MHDRCTFIGQEITTAFIDDFMALPAEPIIGNVCQGLPAAEQRHADAFYLTH